MGTADPNNTVWQRTRGYVLSSLFFLSVGIAAYVLWEEDLVPGKIESLGSLRIETPQGAVDVPTRVVNGRGRGVGPTQGQIQLPDGEWIACREDCRAAYLSYQSGKH